MRTSPLKAFAKEDKKGISKTAREALSVERINQIARNIPSGKLSLSDENELMKVINLHEIEKRKSK